jgi:hypothetical protein
LIQKEDITVYALDVETVILHLKSMIQKKEMTTLDVETLFFHRDLEEEIIMRISEGYYILKIKYSTRSWETGMEEA